jgi:hypothetical protein
MASPVGCASMLPFGPLALILSGHRAPEMARAPRSGTLASCRMGLVPANEYMGLQPCIDASTAVGPAGRHMPQVVILLISVPGGPGGVHAVVDRTWPLKRNGSAVSPGARPHPPVGEP